MKWFILVLKKCLVIFLLYVLIKNLANENTNNRWTGFIGSNLCDYLLEKNNKLVILDNLETGNIKNLLKSKNKIKFFKVDITNMKKLKDKYFKKIDVVFHLAALADIVPSINNPEKYFNTNVKGTLNILEKCKKNKVKKLIYAASSSCYGIPKKLPINENAEIKPEYPMR